MTRLDYLFKNYENILGWYRQSEDKARVWIKHEALNWSVALILLFALGVSYRVAIANTAP